MSDARAFRADFGGAASLLLTDVVIYNPTGSAGMTARALWDTGAMVSVISPFVYDSLSLSPTGKTLVNGVNSSTEEVVTHVNIGVPSRVMFEDVRVVVCGLTGADIVIGMDIIAQGSLLVENADGRTVMSFLYPPVPHGADFIEVANRHNAGL